MKSFKAAIATLIILSATVYANSVYITRTSDQILKRLETVNAYNTECAENELTEILLVFRRAEKIISITVSHDDLTNIEADFAEIIGAAKAGDSIGVITAKSRLQESFGHLKRLSDINLYSII